MALSLYQASIPALIRGLDNLAHILDKAAAHAASTKIEPGVLLNARLFPDMYPLVRQVQIASDTAKGAGARLAGIDIPSYADTEATFDELQTRIARTIAFLRGIAATQIDGQEERPITLPTRSRGDLHFTGSSYLLRFVLPNLYFHISTAYAILRHNGVALGKLDYLGGEEQA